MSSEPQALGDLAAEFASQLGIDNLQRVDVEAYGADYLARARRADAAARFHADCPPEFLDTDFNDKRLAPNKASIDAVRNWKFDKRGLLATGPTGRGKTRAIMDLYRRLAVEEGRDVRFWYAGDWFATLQQQINYGRDDARGWVESCAARPIVILDDLGQEALTKARAEWAQAWFFRFMDLRIGNGLPIIATTNLGAQDMAGRGDSKGVRADPLIRRMLELMEVVKFHA